MLSVSHPAIGLQLEYRDGLCSAGAALAVATHLTLCPECKSLPSAAWGGLNLPGVLATDHVGGEAYAEALGSTVLEGWQGDSCGVRFAALRGAAGIGEAAYLVDTAAGVAASLPFALLLVVLQGRLIDGPASFARGAFIDLVATPLREPEGAGPRGCICLVICEAT